MTELASRRDVEELETVDAEFVLREMRSDGTPGPSIPIEAINSLKLVALYAEGLPDTDAGILNNRKDIACITAAAAIAVPAVGLAFTYTKDTADVSAVDPTGTWKARLIFAPADAAIVDRCCDYENHTALFECVHTGGTCHPRLRFRVENLRRVGS